jgi:hypothetical protein
VFVILTKSPKRIYWVSGLFPSSGILENRKHLLKGTFHGEAFGDDANFRASSPKLLRKDFLQ